MILTLKISGTSRQDFIDGLEAMAADVRRPTGCLGGNAIGDTDSKILYDFDFVEGDGIDALHKKDGKVVNQPFPIETGK